MLIFLLVIVLFFQICPTYEYYRNRNRIFRSIRTLPPPRHHNPHIMHLYLENIRQKHLRRTQALALAQSIAAAKARKKEEARLKALADAEAQRSYKEVSMILTFPTHKKKMYELIKYNKRHYDKKEYIKKYKKDDFFQTGQFNNQYSNLLPFHWKSYFERYPDLSSLPYVKEAAIEHWKSHGYEEGRVGSQNMNEFLCEPGELHCMATTIDPQRGETYNIDFNSPFDRYTTTNVQSNYNQSYYKNPFTLNLPILSNKPNEFNNVSGHIQPYTYCNWEKNVPTCVFTTRRQSQEKHNAQVGNWLRTKQQTQLLNSKSNQRRIRSTYSNIYERYKNDSLKYIQSI